MFSYPHVIKSKFDPRKYHAFKLPNDLPVLVIQEQGCEQAAACLSVATGQFHDTPELPGLAHLLEHMVFMGSQKYPTKNHLNNFVSKYGSEITSATENEITRYHFSIHIAPPDEESEIPTVVRDSLDHFAHMFRQPLFTSEALRGEVQVIETQFQDKIQSRYGRVDAVLREMASPGHPYGLFAHGSRESLEGNCAKHGIDLKERLVNLFNRRYSSNLMRLCFISPYDVTAVEKIIRSQFSNILNMNVKHPINTPAADPVFKQSPDGLSCYVQTGTGDPLLRIHWELHPKYSQVEPLYYICELLKHQGSGSIANVLKRYGWAEGVSVSTDEGLSYCFIWMDIRLTPIGCKKIKDIIAVVHKYIRLLKANGVQERIYNECKQIMENHFLFSFEHPSTVVREIAMKMHRFSPKQYRTGAYRFQLFNHYFINALLDDLTPGNAKNIVSGRFPTGRIYEKAEYHGSRYCIMLNTELMLTMWNGTDTDPFLRIPSHNQYIPKELTNSFLPESEETDKLSRVFQARNVTVWHFALPNYRPAISVSINFISYYAYSTAENAILQMLLTRVLRDKFKEVGHQAIQTGLKWRLNENPAGFSLVVSGFKEHMEMFVSSLLSEMVDIEIDSTLMTVCEEQVKRGLVRFQTESALKKAQRNSYDILYNPYWNPTTIGHAEQKVLSKGEETIDKLINFANELFRSQRIQVYVRGSCTKNDAKKIGRSVNQIFGAYNPVQELPNSNCMTNIPKRTDLCIRRVNTNITDRNSAIRMHFQFGKTTEFRSPQVLILFARLLQKAMFHELRIKKQLLYEMDVKHDYVYGVHGLVIAFQSPVSNPDELLRQVEEFLKKFREKLFDLFHDDNIEMYVKSVRDVIATRWEQDLIELLDNYILKGARRRALLVSQIFAQQHRFRGWQRRTPRGMTLISNAVNFKRRSNVYASEE